MRIADGIYTFDGILSREERDEYISWTEGLGYSDAPISTAAGFVLRPDIRNNARVIVDHTDRACLLWSRVEGTVPRILRGRQVIGLNERFRFYRYDPGERFAPHTDGCFRRNNGQESLLTIMIYLDEGCEGGETNFGDVQIVPKAGMALIFDHYLLNEGAAVLSGRKYVLRSDVMYGPVGELRG